MNCPICSQPLKLLDEDSFICPNNDGVLITNKHLLDKDKQLVSDVEAKEADTATPLMQRDKDLICPHCSSTMRRVDYNFSGIIIDTCTKCQYRWLDRGEFKNIVEFKPRVEPNNLLFLLDLKQKTEAISKTGSDDSNPNVALSTGALGGIIKGSAAGDSQRTLSYMTGAAMYGLIVGIIKSKFIRMLAPFIIIAFIILGYLIYKQVRLVDWANFP